MYEKLLVLSDGSDLSELVLPYVEELGERLGSQIILLHVCPPELGRFSHKHMVYIENMGQVVKEHLKGADKVEPVLLAGEPIKEIIGYAKKENIGLIALVSHGQSGVKPWVVGSTANKVLRATRKPVLLIRAQAPLAVRGKGILNKLLVPLDGSKEGEAILPCVEGLVSGGAIKPEAEVTLLQVIAPEHYVPSGGGLTREPYSEEGIEQLKAKARTYLEKAGSGLKTKGVSAKSEVAVGDAAQEIIELAGKINANLTAMSSHGYSGFSQLFLGSVSDRVLHHGNTPLLLAKPAGA